MWDDVTIWPDYTAWKRYLIVKNCKGIVKDVSYIDSWILDIQYTCCIQDKIECILSIEKYV